MLFSCTDILMIRDPFGQEFDLFALLHLDLNEMYSYLVPTLGRTTMHIVLSSSIARKPGNKSHCPS